jgi:hypothetical protein
MPFDRSRQERHKRLKENSIDIPDVFFRQLADLAKPAGRE